ncbi:hypothetical protein K2P97_09630 [bacterium]|nr:hypothetical protein [bacterium]
MNQIKLLVLGVITTASLNIKADVLSGFMDLSNLYGNTNAGRYFVGLALNIDKTAVLEVSQSLGAAQGNEPWDEPKVCLTDLNLIAGRADLILTDADRDESLTTSQQVRLNATHYDETEKCSSVEEILAKGISFSSYINMGTIKLNRKAPFDYESLETYISVFPYGYSINLQATQYAKGRFIVMDLKSQMSSQLKRGSKNALSHYTTATKDQTTLSLGQGQIELK